METVEVIMFVSGLLLVCHLIYSVI